MSTTTETCSASDLPARRAPDVGWASSPVMQRLMRDISHAAGHGGPQGIAGEPPYGARRISRASRVVVIGRRTTSATASTAA